MTRPEKEIDWKKVDDLMIAGCMGTEIAPYFDMHPKTFYGKVEDKYKMTFTEYSQEKKAKGESLLRAQQYAKALGLTDKGDNTLLIWLGKQRLNQRDNKDDQIQHPKVVFEVNYKNDGNNPVQVSPKVLPDNSPLEVK